MTDPYLYFNVLKNPENSVARAPELAVQSWVELANYVKLKLDDLGFTASVVSGDNPPMDAVGALVCVHEIDPLV